jgi:MIP family channel proteins
MSEEETQPQSDPVGHEEDTFKALLRPAAAEFLGSFFFIFVAVGSAMNIGGTFITQGTVQIGIALAFGFTIFAIAFSIGHISGGHLNCAVTLAFVVTRKISVKRGLLYFGGQFFGGLIGAAFLKWLTPAAMQTSCMASNDLGQSVSIWDGFGVEFACTFFLLLVVSAASDSQKSNTTLVPLAIGYAVAVCHLMALPITGCSINPTRSFASAFVSIGTTGCGRVWTNHWIFWIAPLLGGLAGAWTYHLLFFGGGPFDNLISMYSSATHLMFGPGFGAPSQKSKAQRSEEHHSDE